MATEMAPRRSTERELRHSMDRHLRTSIDDLNNNEAHDYADGHDIHRHSTDAASRRNVSPRSYTRHSAEYSGSLAPPLRAASPAPPSIILSRHSTRDQTALPPPHPPPTGGSSCRNLDRYNQGDWALDQHLTNLVMELEPPSKVRNIRKLGRASTAAAGPTDKEDHHLDQLHRDSERGRDDNDNDITDRDRERRFRINFAEVQRMRVRKLQCRLVRDVVDMRYTGREVDGWEEALDKYIQALRDYDYMEKRSQSARDPFLATGEYYIDHYIIMSYLPDELLELPPADDAAERLPKVKSVCKWEDSVTDRVQQICGTRTANQFSALVGRIAVAALGGVFLLGPMWLMVLHNTLWTALVSTTVFVTAFGVVVASFIEEHKDVLASTAAYAAVLVVFVGASTAGPVGGSAG
ncbi:hypothetical protein B0H66DRAFT_563764 [Apodospora peruviana]|uniref:DUF6594 domain-containing protein n=1 Tax=Apodospora peruviana TaxID=516989 RepID=A0AAE0M0Y1_9PEZI|nr:hypothetical protein B0H66DRAFT_563764 [Apodospora peruviana]